MSDYRLNEVMIPEKRFYTPQPIKGKVPQSWPQASIYISPEFSQADVRKNVGNTALVLIQGRGPSRAGVWAQSTSINENFELGTCFPQVHWA